MRTGSPSKPMTARCSLKARCAPGPNVKRRNEPPGRHQASDEWITRSPSALNSQRRRISMASRSLLPFFRNMPMSRSGEETDPFLTLRREMNRLFDDAFGGFGLPSLFGPVLGPVLRHMSAAPKVDVSETENELRITAEMPGTDENNVEVLLDDDRLIIRGEKKEEREDKDRNCHLRERVEGVFSRTLPLPFSPDPSQVKADFKNGVDRKSTRLDSR